MIISDKVVRGSLHLNSLTFHYDKVCMLATCTIMNQVVTNVVMMLECHFEGGPHKEGRVYIS